jgi:hypothetical protein
MAGRVFAGKMDGLSGESAMGQLRQSEKKVTESATAVWADGALSIDLPEDATLADVAERVTAHSAGRRPLYVTVTLAEPAPLHH